MCGVPCRFNPWQDAQLWWYSSKPSARSIALSGKYLIGFPSPGGNGTFVGLETGVGMLGARMVLNWALFARWAASERSRVF
jgi:hypothetical protein